MATDDTANKAETTAGFNITGKGEAGATVTLTFDSGTTLAGGNTAVVNSEGIWTVAVAAADVSNFDQGTESFAAKQVDIAGNVSGLSTAKAIGVDTLVPTAATVALGSGVSDGATDAEAEASSGVVNVTGESGASIVATFTGQSGSVVKTVTGTGSAVAVALTAEDVDTLGEGSVSVSVAQTDAAGNPQEATPNTATFAVDTIAPAAPVLALGSGVGDGATDAESAASGGLITVKGESGSAIDVTLTGQSGTIAKSITGDGTAQAIALTSSEVDTLGEGAVAVSATQTDAAGNAQTVAAATTTLTIDTVAPSAPIVALGTGVANGATDAEAAATGGVITVTGEAGAVITAVFSGPEYWIGDQNNNGHRVGRSDFADGRRSGCTW